MTHSEDKSNVNFRIDCHDPTEISEASGLAVPGIEAQCRQVSTLELKTSEACLLLPKALIGKSKPSKANAASAMDFSQWNGNERTHQVGRVNMSISMNLDEEANPIILVEPMV